MARGRAHTTLTEVSTGTNAQNWKLQPRTHCFESPICVTASDDDDKNDNSTRDRFCLSLLFTASINGWMKYSHFDAVGTHFDVVSLVLFFDFISLRATTALCLGLVFFWIVLDTRLNYFLNLNGRRRCRWHCHHFYSLARCSRTISFNSVQSSLRAFPYTLRARICELWIHWIVSMASTEWIEENRLHWASEWVRRQRHCVDFRYDHLFRVSFVFGRISSYNIFCVRQVRKAFTESMVQIKRGTCQWRPNEVCSSSSSSSRNGSDTIMENHIKL